MGHISLGDMRTGFVGAYAANGATFLAAQSMETAVVGESVDGVVPGTFFGSSPLCANSFSAEVMALIVGQLMVLKSQALTLYTDCCQGHAGG